MLDQLAMNSYADFDQNQFAMTHPTEQRYGGRMLWQGIECIYLCCKVTPTTPQSEAEQHTGDRFVHACHHKPTKERKIPF